jgi:hypothetical protein
MAPPQHLKEAATAVASSHSPVRGGDVHEAASVPLVLLNNDPSQKFVRAVLEGANTSREALMLVDTGAQITVIDEETAQELDVEHVQDALLAGVTGTSRGWIGRLQTLRVGEDVVNDLLVMVGPMAGRRESVVSNSAFAPSDMSKKVMSATTPSTGDISGD